MRLEILCENKTGIARKLLEILENYDLNLYAVEANSNGIIHVHFPELEFERFKNLMPEIRKLDHVLDVRSVKNMPLETEHYALNSLPDPVFFIDLKGKVTRTNEAALTLINISKEKIENETLNQWLQGFSFINWFDDLKGINQTVRVQVDGINYLAEILPIYITENLDIKTLSGGIVLLKSSSRLSKQINILQTDSTKQPKNKSTKTIMAGFETIRSQSSAIKRTLLQAKKVALLEEPILIMGEVGTGRRRIAKACHDASNRKNNKFTSISCATLEKSHLNDILFGCKEKKIVSVFEQSNFGTVYLDEISELTNEMQISLINLIKTATLNNNLNKNFDVRIICSNKKSLVKLMKAGKFRQDLLFQINTCSLSIPPLRKSKEDILILAKYFLQQYSDKQGETEFTLSKKSLDKLQAYDWPGNVKELKNIIFQAISMVDGSTELTPQMLNLPSDILAPKTSLEAFSDTLEEATKKFQADLIRQLYPIYPSTRKLAKKLGVSHTAIANKLKEYGIDKN
jgi:transcriptional regulator of aroF, aroG, tyrA and aromatic amino acid transport